MSVDLFTYLESIGDSAIGEHLTEEHTAMRPVGARLAPLARAVQSGGFDPTGWKEFRGLGSELVQRTIRVLAGCISRPHTAGRCDSAPIKALASASVRQCTNRRVAEGS